MSSAPSLQDPMQPRPSVVCADTEAAFYRGLVTSPLIDVGYFPASRYITLSSES